MTITNLTSVIRGVVREGKAEARSFTQLGWVRQQFLDKLGFVPYPGTLNLQVDQVALRRASRARPAIIIDPAPGHCTARCFKVRLNYRVDAVWILPEIADYPRGQIELMAPVSLRDELKLRNGDNVTIQIE